MEKLTRITERSIIFRILMTEVKLAEYLFYVFLGQRSGSNHHDRKKRKGKRKRETGMTKRNFTFHVHSTGK